MSMISAVREKMTVIGADGVLVGTVESVENQRIKLIAASSGQGHHKGHNHYVPASLVADIHENEVRLSANASNALMFQEEEDGSSSL